MSTVISWVDGDYTVPSAVSGVVLEQPFDGDSGMYLLRQDLWQFRANFVPLALNTPYPTIPYTSYVLVAESALIDLGGGLVKWTRTYAKVPASRDDPTSLAYQFVGFYGTFANLAVASTFPVVGRPQRSEVVTCRVTTDYFLIGTGGTYATADLIPIILATKYYIPQGHISGGFFIPIYAPGSADDITYGTDTPEIWDSTSFSNLIPTIPSRATYLGWVTAGTWLVAENSVIQRWQGNIHQRQTKYVKAR